MLQPVKIIILYNDEHSIKFCYGSYVSDFAYVNEYNDGAKGQISILLLACTLQKTVTIIWTDADANGCAKLLNCRYKEILSYWNYLSLH